MRKSLTLDKLSEGLEFYTGCVADVYIEFFDDARIASFIAKYEQDCSIIVQSQVDDGFMFKMYGSGEKEIRLSCAIMSEDIDVIDLRILSMEEN